MNEYKDIIGSDKNVNILRWRFGALILGTIVLLGIIFLLGMKTRIPIMILFIPFFFTPIIILKISGMYKILKVRTEEIKERNPQTIEVLTLKQKRTKIIAGFTVPFLVVLNLINNSKNQKIVEMTQSKWWFVLLGAVFMVGIYILYITLKNFPSKPKNKMML